MKQASLSCWAASRPLPLLLMVAAHAAPVDARPWALETAEARYETRNVVLVTFDGVRRQEIFRGVDETLLEAPERAGIEDPEALRERFWRSSAEARRRALLPFFWRTLVPGGVLIEATLANPHRFSYPGYAELLTGRVVDEIDSNDAVRIPRETVLDVLRRTLDLPPSRLAAFGSWERFHHIVTHREGGIFVNAGDSTAGYDSGHVSDGARRWLEVQERIPSPWATVRYNAVTEGLALEYLEEQRPRFVYLAFDETDEWAHARRYDHAVRALHLLDAMLERLWTTLQSVDGYRGRTTLIVTTDHGRGITPDDWTSHGADVAGAEDIWIAAIGPDTPSRGLVATDGAATLGQVAATVLSLLGVDPGELGATAAAPLPELTK